MAAAAGSLHIGVDGRELQGRPTGTGRYLRNLLRHWGGQGRDALTVYFNGPAPAHPVLAAANVTVRAVGAGGARGLAWEQRLLPPAADSDALDVFFSPAYTCPLRMRAPRVTTVHDLSFFALPHEFSVADGARRRARVAASIDVSARVLAQSAFTRRELAAFFPEAAGRVREVPLGPDDDLPPSPDRAEAREALALEGPLLLTVGSIFQRRCLPELLRATAALARRHPGLTLDVVGENRTHPRLDVAGLVRALGLERRVRLSGFADDEGLALRYGAADVAVFLSEYEGFGLGVLEAMARGVPVVTSTRPALGELYAEAALLVDPRSPEAIAEAIGRLLTDPGLRAGLVARGQALAARYSWARTGDLTRAVLAEAAGG